MQVKKGDKLLIKHQRHGTFKAYAAAEFNTEVDEFFPVKVSWANGPVHGRTQDWYEGESIPCKAAFCTVTLLEAKENEQTKGDKSIKPAKVKKAPGLPAVKHGSKRGNKRDAGAGTDKNSQDGSAGA